MYLTRVNDTTPLSNRAIKALVKKYTKAFKSNKSMSPHKLRHTYGTNLMEQSEDIHLLMTQLGHTSTTTAALYTNPEQEKAKAKKAAKLLGEKNKLSLKGLKKEKIPSLLLFSLRAHNNAKYSTPLWRHLSFYILHIGIN
jgi:hypothetical protein